MRLSSDLCLLGLLALGVDARSIRYSRRAANETSPGSGYSKRAWDAAAAKATDFVSQLSLGEKVWVVTGSWDIFDLTGCIGATKKIDKANFTGYCMLDGPSAVNRQDGVSIFPSGITMGATWDVDMMYQRGVALGVETKGKGGHVWLGPSCGPIGRNPLGGRNWEGFGSDPYLNGQAMAATIEGVQSVGVQTSSKHFIGNEQETQRTRTDDGVEAVSSNIDDRTLHELYLWPFADAVRAGTTSVMCSYNRVNQTYACANEHLLKGVLRDELGFRGYVVSDWYATHGTSEFANAGLDIEMPGVSVNPEPFYFGPLLEGAVLLNQVKRDRLDAMAEAVMTPYFLLGQDDPEYPVVDPATAYEFIVHETGWDIIPVIQFLKGDNAIPEARNVRGDHPSLIRKIGAAGTVLLKNEGSILPLTAGPMNIGVFGNDAIDPTDGLSYLDISAATGFEYGTLDIGGGSGTGRHSNLVSPLTAIKAKAAATGAKVQYLTSNRVISANNFRTIFPKPDVCLVFLKTWGAETQDRTSFEADWNSTKVVENVAGFCENTVVITHSAGINTMPWAGSGNVKAILTAHLPGEETGNSIVDVLWGDVNPSGRLPYTIPKRAEDYDIPVVNLTGQEDVGSKGWQANFTEGLMTDYRHFDSKNIEPLYEFGFGLSYTTFALEGDLTFTKAPATNGSTAALSAVPDPDVEILPGGNPQLWDTLLTGRTSVKNTGERAGASVVQLYLSYPSDSVPKDTPVRVLRGFSKVSLEPGETKPVEFSLRRRDLSYWNVETQQWQIPEGEFNLQVGFSSRDLKLEAKVALL